MNDVTTGKLTITPHEALADEKIQIRAEELSPFQQVTIKAELNEQNKQFISFGHFTANDKGEVDVSQHCSTGGTYTGKHDMGLIWSMVSGPGQDKRSRYYKKDVTMPAIVQFTLWGRHLSWDELFSGTSQPILTTEIRRWYKTKGVRREEVRDGNVRGALFIPPGDGPFPGVIDMFGMCGGLREFRASLLASRGFAVLALPLFAYADLPKKPENISLPYLQESVEWLSTHPSVIPGGVGVIGVSKGGEVAHMMSLYCPKVRAVVKINGPPFHFGIPIVGSEQNIPVGTADLSKTVNTPEGHIIKDVYAAEDEHFIQSWKRDVPILCILSEDDLCLNTEYNIRYYRMIPKEKRKYYTILKYKGAGHLIEPPYGPYCRVSYEKYLGGYTVWGGNARDHNYAQEDAWKKVRTFLWTHLKNLNTTSATHVKCQL